MAGILRPEWRVAWESFDLAAAMGRLGGTAAAMNAAVECCDRHPADAVALEWVGADGGRATWTFGALRAASGRVAHVLAGLGIGVGDRVTGLLPRRPELLAVMLGVWRVGAVWQPLFTAFGAGAVTERVRAAGSRLIVTDGANRGKVEAWDGRPPVMMVGAGAGGEAGDLDYAALTAGAGEAFAPVLLPWDAPFLLLFTSGTTGPAKRVAVPLRAMAAFVGYMEQAIDLRPEDRFWNLADPGWAYGLYYAVIGPLALGHATTLYDGAFSVPAVVDVIERLGVTNLCGSPTAFRLLMAAGGEAVAGIRGRLRVVNSAGEPLNPEVIRWMAEHLGVVVHDQYGQTELGMVVCNHHGLAHPVRAGSAGFAVPGHMVAVVDGAGLPVQTGTTGMLAVDMAHSPLFWFGGYEGAAVQPFVGGYYLTGDMVEGAADGSVAFVGRADDVITSSGYRIGPFDVESALIEHPAVVEAAVVGKPDLVRTEIVKAFVVLAAGWDGDAALVDALQLHVRRRLSAHAYPREVVFVGSLPKTPSGKLQRFLLRDAEWLEPVQSR